MGLRAVRLATAAGLLLAITVLGAGPAFALTTPEGGAEAKVTDFVIVPPWAAGTRSITCGYGCGLHDGTDSTGGTNDQYALDFVMATGDPVHPVAPGTVVYAGPGLTGATTGWTHYGNMVYVRHDGGYSSLYAHLDWVDVVKDQLVTPETPLGGAGESGTEGGVHLHFALYHGATSDSRGMPYGGVSVVPEPFAECTGDCEDLVAGSLLMRTAPDSAVAPPVQWIEPVDGAEVGPSLRLSAWPTPLLVDGQLTDPTDVARVDFTASWSGGTAPACSATSADAEGLWSCTADLTAMGVPAGPITLSFDALRTDGSTLAAPDGSQAVTYVPASANVVWAKATTKNASHVSYGEPVTLVARFRSPVDVAEVRFTAYYPDWANAKDAAKVAGFDPRETWRTLKVCRLTTKGCTWDGDERAANVTYRWDPTVGEKKRSIDGVPKADPAITLASEACVPVTLGIDVVDTLGTTGSAPGGRIAQRCDAKAEGLARTVYLDPLAPPAAPRNVVETILSTRGIPETDGVVDKIRVTWDDVSGEAGYRVYVRPFRVSLRTDARGRDCWFPDAGRPELLATLPADTTVFRYTDTFEGTWAVGRQYLVTAFNRSGEATGASREPITPKYDYGTLCR